jgi:hypothetical protein
MSIRAQGFWPVVPVAYFPAGRCRLPVHGYTIAVQIAARNGRALYCEPRGQLVRAVTGRGMPERILAALENTPLLIIAIILTIAGIVFLFLSLGGGPDQKRRSAFHGWILIVVGIVLLIIPPITLIVPKEPPKEPNKAFTDTRLIDETQSFSGQLDSTKYRDIFKFVALTTNTKVILGKALTAGIEVYDRTNKRVTWAWAPDKQPVILSFESNPDSIYYIVVESFDPKCCPGDEKTAGTYHLTVRGK